MNPGSFLGDSPEMWLLLAVPLGLFLLFFIYLVGDGAQRQMSRRIDRIKKGHGEKPSPVQIISARRATKSGAFPGLDELITLQGAAKLSGLSAGHLRLLVSQGEDSPQY